MRREVFLEKGRRRRRRGCGACHQLGTVAEGYFGLTTTETSLGVKVEFCLMLGVTGAWTDTAQPARREHGEDGVG